MVKFKPILPKPFDPKPFRREMEKAVEKTTEKIKLDFFATRRHWRTRVEFTVRYQFLPSTLMGEVYTTNRTYILVNEGARPHNINPRPGNKKQVLTYQRRFRSKSLPRVIGSRQGGKSGSWISRKGVRHPGHQPRRFDNQIAHNRAAPFAGLVRVAFEKARRECGHAI